MSEGIVIAKLNWSKFYQGEEETETTFSDGDNYERFNFRRTADGFYGSIPRRAPDKKGEWLVVFIARDTDDEHYAVGWYENALSEEGPRPEYKSDPKMLLSKYGKEFTYSVRAKAAYLLPPKIRHYFKAPSMKHFGQATYIFATGSSDDTEPWRQEFASFAGRVVRQSIGTEALDSHPSPRPTAKRKRVIIRKRPKFPLAQSYG